MCVFYCSTMYAKIEFIAQICLHLLARDSNIKQDSRFLNYLFLNYLSLMFFSDLCKCQATFNSFSCLCIYLTHTEYMQFVHLFSVQLYMETHWAKQHIKYLCLLFTSHQHPFESLADRCSELHVKSNTYVYATDP